MRSLRSAQRPRTEILVGFFGSGGVPWWHWPSRWEKQIGNQQEQRVGPAHANTCCTYANAPTRLGFMNGSAQPAVARHLICVLVPFQLATMVTNAAGTAATGGATSNTTNNNNLQTNNNSHGANNNNDDFDFDQDSGLQDLGLPVSVQTFLWRQIAPFIRPKLGKLHESTCLVSLASEMPTAFKSIAKDRKRKELRWPRSEEPFFPHTNGCCIFAMRVCCKDGLCNIPKPKTIGIQIGASNSSYWSPEIVFNVFYFWFHSAKIMENRKLNLRPNFDVWCFIYFYAFDLYFSLTTTNTATFLHKLNNRPVFHLHQATRKSFIPIRT